MSFVTTSQGLYYPASIFTGNGIVTVMTSMTAINAATDKVAFIGYIYIDGTGSTTKTLDTSGSSAISFMLGTTTFANSGTTLDIGLQDIDAVNGPPCRPDGVFDVKVTLTGNASSPLSTGAWNNISLAAGSGSKTVTDGQLLALVFDMTARGGVDSVVLQAVNAAGGNLPTTNQFDAGAWAAGTEIIPNCVITFSDGTIATFCGSGFYTVARSQENYSDSTNPDERGNVFTVPFTCKVNAIWADMGITDANSDFTIKLYSDPLGTPALMTSLTVLAQNLQTSGGQLLTTWPIPEQTLSPGTTYGATVRANGSTNVNFSYYQVNSAAYWALNGTSGISKMTRDGDSGAFSNSATTTQYKMGIRISAVDDGNRGGPIMGGHIIR